MSHSRHDEFPRAVDQATPAGPDASEQVSLRAVSTVTGWDGTVLATVSRHTEPAGGPVQAPLVVVDVRGDVDADTTPLLRKVLTQAVDHNRRVCCDLSGVTFLGAAGVNTLLAVLLDAEAAGCAFTARGVHGVSARVFQITGLDAVLPPRGRGD